MDIIWEDKTENLYRAEKFITQAAEQQADLILFPEMSLTGFSMNTALTAEDHRNTVEQFRALAQAQNINVGFGWVSAAEDKAQNHYSVVSREGQLVSDYVKIHPFSFGEESKHFIGGDRLAVFILEGVSCSTFICYDLRFPEIFQAVSNEVSLIIVAANWPATRKEHWRLLLQARAIENQVFIVGVNCVGPKGGLYYSGNSMVVDPEGNILAELTEEEGLLLIEIDPSKVAIYRRSFPLKADRRTELYQIFYKRKREV